MDDTTIRLALSAATGWPVNEHGRLYDEEHAHYRDPLTYRDDLAAVIRRVESNEAVCLGWDAKLTEALMKDPRNVLYPVWFMTAPVRTLAECLAEAIKGVI